MDTVMDKKNLFGHARYLFLFAHPDDDLYCCVLLKRLVEGKKQVKLVYVTSGDAGGGMREREEEVLCAARHTGVDRKNIVFLRIPEKELPDTLHSAVDAVADLAAGFDADCAVGHDYEGGHECHDFASFCLSEAVRRAGTGTHVLFPVYHGPPDKRIGARFKDERKGQTVIAFSGDERLLKEAVLSCYVSQKRHFEKLGRSAADYCDILLSRESFFCLRNPIDYASRPAEVVGYEAHRNRYTFEMFQQSLLRYRSHLAR